MRWITLVNKMKFALLASGSKGNCCIVKAGNTQLVIDCGSTKRYLSGCFDQLHVDHMQSDGLLITHTHTDHVSQLKMFYDVPVYAPETVQGNRVTTIMPYQHFQVRDIDVTVLPMSHDCEHTVGYVLKCQDKKMVYITDTGYIKEEVKPYIQNADYYVFESNHDIEMLMQTRRPVYVKQRIINDYGHLCNEDSAYILSNCIGDRTREIVLAHISQEGNTRELALQTLKQTLVKKQVSLDRMKLYAADQFSIYIGGGKE